MKKTFFTMAVVSLLLFAARAKAQTIINPQAKPVNAEKWAAKTFKKGVVPPFSFDYQGKNSKTFIANWNYKAETLPSTQKGEKAWRYTYSDPTSKLKITCDVKAYPSYNAVDWVVRFTNEDSENSPRISNVCVADVDFAAKSSGFWLHYNQGSTVTKNDFSPMLKTFNSVDDKLHMENRNGRSSEGEFFPFYNVETPDEFGAIVAVGWTGTWKSDFSMSDGKNLVMQTGLAKFDSYLKPSESFRGASVCFLFWNGKDRFAGHNKFRRFMREMHSRKINGKPAIYPMCMGFDWGSYPAPCNEYTCLTSRYAKAIVQKNTALKLTPDCFWLDAGWYEGAGDAEHNKAWYNTVGNWQADHERFPNGLQEVADEIHKTGAKFMVWFEPERICAGTRYATTHPEWMLKCPENKSDYLIDFSNPAAVDWVTKDIGDVMALSHIDYYRQDCNINLAVYWNAADTPGRVGITEAHYIEGLYKFWDGLLTRFPTAIIDNCASGGNRLDYETMMRSAPLWRTDYDFGEPDGQQCHTFGLNLYLSQHSTGTYGFRGTDEYTFRSFMQSSGVFNWVIMDDKIPASVMQARRAEFMEVRPYYLEDFYQLTSDKNITADNVWVAYQLNRPSDTSGYIMAFRRPNSPDNTCTVKLQALNPKKNYVLTDYDSKKQTIKTGEELAEGYVLTLEPRTSALIKYEVKK